MKGMETMIASMLGINPAELKAQAEAVIKFVVAKTTETNERVGRIEASIARMEKLLTEVSEPAAPHEIVALEEYRQTEVA